MRDVIKFGKTVTLEDLNPHNFHLKNDYINNLLFAALSVFPYLNNKGIDAKVLRAFISAGYMDENMPEFKNERYSQKYSQGLGLLITWEDYTDLEAISEVSKLVSTIKSNVLARINHAKKQVEILFEMSDKSKVFELVGTEERQIA